MIAHGERGARRLLSSATLAAALIAAALACWIVTVQRMRGMDMGPGTPLGSAPFFLGVWVTMMAAMMLPAALPMVLLYDRIARRAAPTAVFVLSYLLVWAAFGAAAYLLYRGVHALDPRFLAWDRQGAYVCGAAIAAAGLYELTPVKRVCLRRCRGPLRFVLGSWRPGARGALRMGMEHGAWCTGCCWGLMVILFALGVMSITWMLAVTGVVFAQKVLPFGARLQWPLSLALVGLGVWVAVAAGSVPGLVQPM